MISVHSSGSSFSAAAVDPMTSQKSMVTTRRSPCMAPPERAASSRPRSFSGIYCAWRGTEVAAGASVSCAPQLKQNLASLGRSVPHFGQPDASEVPQDMQNLASSGLAA